MSYPTDSTKPHAPRDLLPRDLHEPSCGYDFMDFHLPTAVWGQVDRPEQSGNPPPPEGDRLAQILQRHPPAAPKLRKPTLASVAKQASKAAIEVARYEVKPDGTIVVVTGALAAADINPWDEVLTNAADQKRPS